ncbi:MAG: protease modulator HflK [Lachnospiraceae bacterium]|nr:protease modulator HflK [Lachnospiraceae bacterium]
MKKTFLEDVLQTMSKWLMIISAVVVVIIAFSGVRIIKSGEVGIILRFGKIVGETREEQIREPGLLFAFPYFIDEVVTVRTDTVIEQRVNTYYTYGEIGENQSTGYLITGDQNVALIAAAVKYTVSDPVKYALEVNSIDLIVNGCVSNAMLETASHTDVDDILTSGKEAFIGEVLALSSEMLDKCGSGVELKAVELTSVAMPEEVRPVYEEVNAATVNASTLIENARKYVNTTIPYAETYANNTIELAKSKSALAISEARASLSEFWGILDEYESSPSSVRYRVYMDKVTKALKTIGKLRVVQDDGSKIIMN